MNELQIFQNEEFGTVRTVEINGEPWFVAADIAKALDYRMASDMTRRLDDEDKGTQKVSTPGGEQNMTVINESGLYSAILGSNLPSAKQFKRWVTAEVLPSIRKTGSYAVAKKRPMQLIAEMALEMDRIEQEHEEMKRVQELQAAELKEIRAQITTSPNEYYTISGYANLKGYKVDLSKAGILGKYATKLSLKYGYEIGKVSDARFGAVNSYHLDILKETFRGQR